MVEKNLWMSRGHCTAPSRPPFVQSRGRGLISWRVLGSHSTICRNLDRDQVKPKAVVTWFGQLDWPKETLF